MLLTGKEEQIEKQEILKKMSDKIKIQYCPICFSNRTRTLLKWCANYYINVCSRCNLIFVHPFPTQVELNHYYQGFLFKKPSEKLISFHVNQAKKELTQVFEIEHIDIKGKSFLDYGGGTGILAQAAKELGFNVFFYDIDEEARSFVEQTFKIATLRNDREIDCLKFDFIYMDNVIEHTIDPVVLIRKLYSKLKTNGSMILKTPNARNTELYFFTAITIKSYLRKAMKYNSFKTALNSYIYRFWTCDPPRHLFAFSEKNIKIMVERAGLKNFQIHYYYSKNLFFDKSLFLTPTKSVDIFIKSASWITSPIILFLIILHRLLKQFGLITPAGIILKSKK